MATIRMPQDRWAEVWKFLTSIGPITRIASAPIYEISAQHLEALCHAGLPFELVNLQAYGYGLGGGVHPGRACH
jgi:hypothetical protein